LYHRIKRFPTPAGVMAKLVAKNWRRNGLGSGVASQSQP